MSDPGAGDTDTLVILHSPPGSQAAYQAIRVAAACAGAGQSCTLFLVGQAVVGARRGQKTPGETRGLNMEEKLGELIGFGAAVHLCGQDGAQYAIARDDLIEGAVWDSVVSLGQMIGKARRVLVF